MSKEWKIIRYDAERRQEWDSFLTGARNATFLFERGYMDYHSDRFADHSLMAYRGEKLSAVLPACAIDGVLSSHAGLTYGGWVLPCDSIDAADEMRLWNAWIDYCRREGFKEIDYKPLPEIYANQPSEADRYLMFRFGGMLTEVNLSSCIDLRQPVKFNKLQMRHLKSAEKTGAEVWETTDVVGFMAMTASCLAERHSATPVHTVEEMILLRDRFPERIRFFVCGRAGEMEAGICLYLTDRVAHCQYIATTSSGREANLLTLLINRLLTDRDRLFANGARDYFDFGTSNEEHGRVLNEGLIRQKFALGGRPVVYERFRASLS